METSDGTDSQEVTLACDLPQPDSVPGSEELPRDPPRPKPTPRGYIGGLIRAVKGIPPCIWVINQHPEEITVVVSKYRPQRLLTSAGITASPTGVGLNFTSTTFMGPASQKTLGPCDSDLGPEFSTAVFPMWTRKEGFGVISVFKGPEKVLFIENDQIPLGATACFTGKPDLRIILHFQSSQGTQRDSDEATQEANTDSVKIEGK